MYMYGTPKSESIQLESIPETGWWKAKVVNLFFDLWAPGG